MTDDSLDKLIRRSVEALDQKPPAGAPAKDELWFLLSERRSRKRTNLVWMSVAATVIAVTIFAVYAPSLYRVSPPRSYHRADSVNLAQNDVLAFIDEYCGERKISCNTPELRDLRLELEQSAQQLHEIDRQLRLYGNDRDLMRAKERVERHQARVIKTIVQIM